MNKLTKCAMALGLTLATGATMMVTAPSASARTLYCYLVESDAPIYEYASTSNKQDSIAEGRLLRGVGENDQGNYWAVQWWKSNPTDPSWESLWTLSSATDNDYVYFSHLRVIDC
ncbi:hypothetical protein [Actinophytocola sediminis]